MEKCSINYPLGLQNPLLYSTPELKGTWQPACSLFNNLEPKCKRDENILLLSWMETKKLAWMPSGNKQRRLTWPVMRYSVRRRMRQLHFHPAYKQEGKICWIKMLPSHTGNVIRGQSLTGCWSFSMKFMPQKKKKKMTSLWNQRDSNRNALKKKNQKH